MVAHFQMLEMSPTEESGLLMSSLCREINALLEESKRGGWGKCKGRKSSWLEPRDLRGWGICSHEQGVAFSSKIFSLTSSKYTPAWFYVCVQNKKEFSVCWLKINHTSGSETWIYSWYTGPLCSEKEIWTEAALTPLTHRPSHSQTSLTRWNLWLRDFSDSVTPLTQWLNDTHDSMTTLTQWHLTAAAAAQVTNGHLFHFHCLNRW
jgi:hypothetical protein